VWREQPLKAKRTNWKHPKHLRWGKHAVAYTDGVAFEISYALGLLDLLVLGGALP